MIALRLWLARFKLRLLDREIADTEIDYADAMLDHRADDARCYRWYRDDLHISRVMLVERIQFLTAKQKGNT
jgi:hypothetical protein